MNYTHFFKNNTHCLKGKTIAISGATGGIGTKLCEHLAVLSADLIFIDRNLYKSRALGESLIKRHPNISITYITADLENINSVKSAVDLLLNYKIDTLILNAGAYSIPRHKCDTGLDNVFQINFVSHYYIAKKLKPYINKVVAVGSIAHNYSKADFHDIDFSTRTRSSLVYGNAKRYLMYSLYGLFNGSNALSIVHPGITLTGITAHYPKIIFAIIKHPMKVLFMKPDKACLSIIMGIFTHCKNREWIGPWMFDVWGMPKKKTLNTCKSDEAQAIYNIAEKIYNNIEKKL